MAALRLLVTGASGQVGGELLHTLAPYGEVLAPTRAEFDLADPASIRAYLRANRPQWIVNAGAYTAVDRAESEPDLAYAINAEAPRVLGEEARALDASVLHFSTDYVFNGQAPNPYIETAPTDPLSVYGATKLAGEQALVASRARYLIFRTSWVYGATGKNFLRTILKLARERDELRIVGDQHGAPTWSRDLARMAAHVIVRSKQTPNPEAFTEIYHAGGSGETTWAEFAAEAIRQVALSEPSTPLAAVVPISTDQYPTPAHRPRNSRLNTEKLQSVFGWTMMHWRDSLAEVLASPNYDDKFSESPPAPLSIPIHIRHLSTPHRRLRIVPRPHPPQSSLPDRSPSGKPASADTASPAESQASGPIPAPS